MRVERPQSGRRLLCVDDDRDSCYLLSALLSLEGYDVVTAPSAREGIDLAKQGGFDTIVLDNWLPEMTGVELCQMIRNFDSKTPILFYSAAAYQSDINTALGSGANAYLTKPSGIDELVRTIEELIGKESAIPQFD